MKKNYLIKMLIVAFGLYSIIPIIYANDENSTKVFTNTSNNFLLESNTFLEFRMLEHQWCLQEVSTGNQVRLEFDLSNTDFYTQKKENQTIYIIYDSNNDNELRDEEPVSLYNSTGNIWQTNSTIEFEKEMLYTLAIGMKECRKEEIQLERILMTEDFGDAPASYGQG